MQKKTTANKSSPMGFEFSNSRGRSAYDRELTLPSDASLMQARASICRLSSLIPGDTLRNPRSVRGGVSLRMRDAKPAIDPTELSRRFEKLAIIDGAQKFFDNQEVKVGGVTAKQASLERIRAGRVRWNIFADINPGDLAEEATCLQFALESFSPRFAAQLIEPRILLGSFAMLSATEEIGQNEVIDEILELVDNQLPESLELVPLLRAG